MRRWTVWLQPPSARCVAAYLYSSAGLGESTTDLAWDGQALIYEYGDMLAICDVDRNIAEMAAALFESLLMNHPFVDGNKRVAFFATDVFLRLNGSRLAVRPDAAHRQKFRPQLPPVPSKHLVKITIAVFEQKADEVLEPPAFHVEKAGRAYNLGQPAGIDIPECFGRKEPFRFQVDDCLLHVNPVCVLGKDSPDAYFERVLSRPPVARPIVVQKQVE